MADPSTIDAITLGTGLAGGGGVVAGFMQYLRGKDAREARDALVTLQGLVARLVADVEKLSAVGRDVATTSNAVAALHRRTDEQDDRLDDHEARLRALESMSPPRSTPSMRPPRHRK